MAILITTSSKLAEEVKKELDLQSKILPRRDIIEKSLEHAAILIANHRVLEKIQHAGSI